MKYKFNDEIEKQLQNFEKYLRSKKYAIETIRQTRNYAGVFLNWLDGKNPQEIDYKMFTDFIFHLKKENTLNLTKHIVLAVRHYYNSFENGKNPAAGIHIRSNRSSILNHIVSYKKLVDLYQNYQTLEDRTKRNKVILGIFIYQGITSGELQQLEVKHVKLKEGSIYIPAYAKSNNRLLDLQAAQLLELQEYILFVRPRMLKNIKACRPGRKPNEIKLIIYDRLFFSENGSACIKNSLLNLFRAIKKTYPKITNAKIIRSSVLVEWLKTQDIRIVQYKAGHRYVSSTERYTVYNLEELKDALKKYHPLK